MKQTVRDYLKAIAATLLAGSLLYSGFLGAHGGEEHEEDSLKAHSSVTAQGDKCVRDEEIMRRQHFEFILHQRDNTLRNGIRTTQYSLKNCVNCHADPKTKSVLGEEGFCQECHSYAAVKIDCFSCHTDKAEPGVKPIPALTHSNAASGDSK